MRYVAILISHEPRDFDAEAIDFAKTAANQAAAALALLGRIILACDAYNAMITTRPYREAMSAEDAVAELRDKSGTQFDPQVVAALLKRLRVPALSPSASAAVGVVIIVAL